LAAVFASLVAWWAAGHAPANLDAVAGSAALVLSATLIAYALNGLIRAPIVPIMMIALMAGGLSWALLDALPGGIDAVFRCTVAAIIGIGLARYCDSIGLALTIAGFMAAAQFALIRLTEIQLPLSMGIPGGRAYLDLASPTLASSLSLVDVAGVALAIAAGRLAQVRSTPLTAAIILAATISVIVPPLYSTAVPLLILTIPCVAFCVLLQDTIRTEKPHDAGVPA
jgi:hypothetical protein